MIHIKKRISSTLFWLICFYSPQLLSQPTVAVYHLEGLHTAQTDGAYDKVLKKIKAQGVDFSLHFSPIIRAKHNFKNKIDDCLCPSDASGSFFPFPTVQSTPINYAKAYIFTRKNEPAISNIQELEGKKIGVRKGMFVDESFAQEVQFEIEQVRDLELNYKKLQAKRIDAFVAYTPDIWNLLGDRELANLNYDSKLSLFTHAESMVCHDTPANRAFIKQFDHELNTLIKQGQIEKILGISYTAKWLSDYEHNRSVALHLTKQIIGLSFFNDVAIPNNTIPNTAISY